MQFFQMSASLSNMDDDVLTAKPVDRRPQPEDDVAILADYDDCASDTDLPMETDSGNLVINDEDPCLSPGASSAASLRVQAECERLAFPYGEGAASSDIAKQVAIADALMDKMMDREEKFSDDEDLHTDDEFRSQDDADSEGSDLSDASPDDHTLLKESQLALQTSVQEGEWQVRHHNPVSH
jgi:hypothetical protein